jgi:hypothetical protein
MTHTPWPRCIHNDSYPVTSLHPQWLIPRDLDRVTATQKKKIVCEDINDFIRCDRHYSRLIDEALLDGQIKPLTKKYEAVTLVNSMHVNWVIVRMYEAGGACTQ